MSYFYSILYLTISSTAIFAIDRKDNAYESSKSHTTSSQPRGAASVTKDNKSIEYSYTTSQGVKHTEKYDKK